MSSHLQVNSITAESFSPKEVFKVKLLLTVFIVDYWHPGASELMQNLQQLILKLVFSGVTIALL